MRKWFLTLCVTALAASFALAPRPAAAFCIDLNDFCDEFDLDIDTGTLYGWWDANCDQAFRQGQLGRRGTTNSGLNDYVGFLFGFASAIEWNFATRTFSFYTWDGVNPPLLTTGGAFTLSATCDGLSPDGGPRLTGSL